MRTRFLLLGRVTATALVALSLAASTGGAQTPDTTTVITADSATASPTRLFEISALGGYQWFDDAAALNGSPTIGFRAMSPRSVLGVPGLTFGVTAAFARPTTRGDYFPWNRQIYYSDINRRNDTTLVFEVSQRVTMVHYGAELGFRAGGAAGPTRGLMDLRAIALEVSGGIGGYAFYEDPEQNRRNEVHAKPALSLGGGLGIPMPGNAMLRFRVDDLIFTGFDREWFSLHDPLFAEELFQNPERTPPAPKSTVHNLRLSVQFSFVPGAGR
jgi:hypothetical protein